MKRKEKSGMDISYRAFCMNKLMPSRTNDSEGFQGWEAVLIAWCQRLIFLRSLAPSWCSRRCWTDIEDEEKKSTRKRRRRRKKRAEIDSPAHRGRRQIQVTDPFPRLFLQGTSRLVSSLLPVPMPPVKSEAHSHNSIVSVRPPPPGPSPPLLTRRRRPPKSVLHTLLLLLCFGNFSGCDT